MPEGRLVQRTDTIATRLDAVRTRVAQAASATGRDPAKIRLVAVSKKQPAEALRTAFAAGQREFGENYVQEGAAKARLLAEWGLPADIRLIGPLQRNKASAAVQTFSAIESVDSAGLAVRLQTLCERFGKTGFPVLIEINAFGEASKAGLDANGAAALLARAEEFPRLAFRGLMAIPPPRESVEASRADFTLLCRLFESLQHQFPAGANIALDELSMGMSHDFETAIECGATEVRIGTAIFGERSPG